MSWPPKDGTPYRPSNGSEGEGFMEEWCCHCKRDQEHQQDIDSDPGCPIIADSMTYDLDHPKYPKAWHWKDGEPICNEFDDIENPEARISDEEREANLNLFPTAEETPCK